MVHPVLVWYLNQIIGYGFRLDREPELIGQAEGGAAGPLVGGNEPMDAGRAYYVLNGRRHCQGVHAIWALADTNAGDGGFSLVPCSHKSNVETPEDVLTGKDDLALANEAVDRFSDRVVVASVDLAKGSKALAGTGRPTMGGLLELPRPYCEPFRKMVAHPAVVHRLTWMGGKGFRCTGFEALCTVKGGAGHFLHGGNEPLSPSRNYTFQNGRSYALGGPSVAVAWQLRDVTEDDGGFACVPGSHKSQYRIPQGVWTCDEDMGLVAHPLTKAGDVIFFMDGPQAHGALAWKNEIPRRVILTRYSSRNFNGGAEMATPEERWGDLLEGMTEAQLAIMRGPDRDERDNNVPRLLVQDGKVETYFDRSQGGLYTKATPKGPSSKG